jgi:hypothetical protein
MVLRQSTITACEEKLRLLEQRAQLKARWEPLEWPRDMAEMNRIGYQVRLIDDRIRILSRGISGVWDKFVKGRELEQAIPA